MAEFTREKRLKTRSERGTLILAETIAEMLPAPHVVLLQGPLGAGKTTLVKGWVEALGLGTVDDVTSPTFTLVHPYSRTGKRTRVYHLDVYRLEQESELAGLGLEEMAAEPDALLLVEWGEKFASLRERASASVLIEPLEGDERSFHLRWRE